MIGVEYPKWPRWLDNDPESPESPDTTQSLRQREQSGPGPWQSPWWAAHMTSGSWRVVRTRGRRRPGAGLGRHRALHLGDNYPATLSSWKEAKQKAAVSLDAEWDPGLHYGRLRVWATAQAAKLQQCVEPLRARWCLCPSSGPPPVTIMNHHNHPGAMRGNNKSRSV